MILLIWNLDMFLLSTSCSFWRDSFWLFCLWCIKCWQARYKHTWLQLFTLHFCFIFVLAGGTCLFSRKFFTLLQTYLYLLFSYSLCIKVALEMISKLECLLFTSSQHACSYASSPAISLSFLRCAKLAGTFSSKALLKT